MRYGLLTYTRTRNIGDEIQSIAAWGLLPRIDYLADRDFLGEFHPSEPTKLIVNGWFSHRPFQFDIGENVDPLFLSFHINQNAKASHDRRAFADAIRSSSKLRELFVHFGPIGARDSSTVEFLHELGIPAYLSGCLTLTLERDSTQERGDQIVLADVSPSVKARVQVLSERPTITLRHKLGKYSGPRRSFASAEKLLRQYQTAHLVITSRLHVALPCLAFGTPVMLVRTNFANPRLEDLSALAHRFTVEEFAKISQSYFEQPPENPSTHLAIRRELIERTREFLSEDVSKVCSTDIESAPSVVIKRISQDAGFKGKAEYAWRWLRRSKTARRLKSFRSIN